MSDRFSLHEAAIDTKIIEANTRTLCRDITAGTIVADVRADGYGHGSVEAALAALAGGAHWLGVSSPDESGELREAGVSAPIVALSSSTGQPLVESAPESSDLPVFVLPAPELYGLVAAESIRPAMRVSGRVVAVKTVAAGEGVSYGYTYRAQRSTRLALVALGYANGLDRYASNLGSLWLRGTLRPVAGRVAMNVVVIEMGDDRASVGDEAVVFGDPVNSEPPIWAWAQSLGKSTTEIASVFGAHLPRRFR